MSGLEFLLGSAIVIGHNVFHVVPNEVPILLILGMVSVRLRNGAFSAIGFKRPDSWARTFGIALAAAAIRIALGDFVIEPLGQHFWPAVVPPEGAENIQGNLQTALIYIGIVWTFAAFGEEICYRGYLLTRAADAAGESNTAFWLSVVIVSILFGYGHFYKGPLGIVDSAVAGLILGAAFMISGRNLWTSILAHGLIDTFGVIALFFGHDL